MLKNIRITWQNRVILFVSTGTHDWPWCAYLTSPFLIVRLSASVLTLLFFDISAHYFQRCLPLTTASHYLPLSQRSSFTCCVDTILIGLLARRYKIFCVKPFPCLVNQIRNPSPSHCSCIRLLLSSQPSLFDITYLLPWFIYFQFLSFLSYITFVFTFFSVLLTFPTFCSIPTFVQFPHLIAYSHFIAWSQFSHILWYSSIQPPYSSPLCSFLIHLTFPYYHPSSAASYSATRPLFIYNIFSPTCSPHSSSIRSF